MLQLLNSRCISQNRRGIAISIDALLALVLFLSMLTLLNLQPVKEVSLTGPKIAVNQMIGDAVTAMDNSGFIMQTIERSTTVQEDIENRVSALLPDTIEYKLELKRYDATLSPQCKLSKDFDTCFPPGDWSTLFTTDTSVPENKDVFRGRKIFIKKEPGDCEFVGQAEARGQSMKGLIAYFQEENHAPQALDVNATSVGSCPEVDEIQNNSCPTEEEDLYCCYKYYDEDADAEDTENTEFKWHRYEETSPDVWEWMEQAGLTGQTVPSTATTNSERWKCEVTPAAQSGTTPGSAAESRPAIIGGPCFTFTTSIDEEALQCNSPATVSITADAEIGDNRFPVDVMMVLDRSGSMGWCSPAPIKDGTTPLMEEDFTEGERQSGIIGSDQITDSGSVCCGERNCVDSGWLGCNWYEPVKGSFVKIYEFDKAETTPFSVVTSWNPSCSSWDNQRNTCPKMYVKNTDTGTEYGYYGRTPPGGFYSDYSSSSSETTIVTSITETGHWEVYAWEYGEARGYSLYFATPEFQEAFTFDIDSADDFSASLHWYDVCTGLCPRLKIVRQSDSQAYGYGEDNIGVTYDSTTLDEYILVPGSGDNIGTWSAYVINDGPDVVLDFLVNYPHWEELGVVTVENDYSFDIFLTWDLQCYNHCPEMQIQKGGTIYGWTGASHISPPGGDNACYEYNESDYPQSRYMLVPGSGSMNGNWTVRVWTEGAHAYSMRIKYVDGKVTSLQAIKDSAVEFVTNPGISPQWGDGVGDQLGLVTYGSNVTIGSNEHLGAATSGHLSDIETGINGMNVDWGNPYTATGDGMKRAIDELRCTYTSSTQCTAANCSWTGSSCEIITRNDIQFMVLLTDGRTNCCASDGCGGLEAELTCKEEALAFAQEAGAAGVKIHIIGYGANVDAEELQQYADASDGMYWNATDPDALELVYQEIAQKIGEEAGIIPDEGSTQILMVSVPEAVEVSDPACDARDTGCTATWDPVERELKFENAEITFDDPDWTGTFDITPQCDFDNCEDDLTEGKTIRFPPEGATIQFDTGSTSQEPLEWPTWDTINVPFHYRDLTVEFRGGTIYGTGDVPISFDIKNIGYLDAELSQANPAVKFYYNTEGSTHACDPSDPKTFLLPDYPELLTDTLCPGLNGGGGDCDTKSIVNYAINQEGHLCLWLDPEGDAGDIDECKGNNAIKVDCMIPETYLYVLDYWAWEK